MSFKCELQVVNFRSCKTYLNKKQPMIIKSRKIHFDTILPNNKVPIMFTFTSPNAFVLNHLHLTVFV